VTIKDDLHALIDELDETDAGEALEFVKARLELESSVSDAYIAECEAAYAEAHASDAILVPHEAVRAWLQSWGSPEEPSADREIEELEQRLTQETRGRSAE
jgi:hypothetical protein